MPAANYRRLVVTWLGVILAAEIFILFLVAFRGCG